jgi:putative transposase
MWYGYQKSPEEIIRRVEEYLGEIFHELARQKESKVVEGHLCPDHIHALLEIPRNTRQPKWWDISKGKTR